MEGDFTVDSDRYKLVDSCLGLWSIALRGRYCGGGTAQTIFRLVEEEKSQVFPAQFFGDLVGMLEKERMAQGVLLSFVRRLGASTRRYHPHSCVMTEAQ